MFSFTLNDFGLYFIGLLTYFWVVRGNHGLYAFLWFAQNIKNLKIEFIIQFFYDNIFFAQIGFIKRRLTGFWTFFPQIEPHFR